MSTKEQRDLLKQLQELAVATKPLKRKIKVDILIDTDNESATTIFERLREAYAVMKEAYQECLHGLKVAEQQYMTQNLPQLADLIYALKQTRDFADGTRKEYDVVIKALERRICELHFGNAVQETPIRGDYASITPRYLPRHGVPNREKNLEAYEATMEWLGVPEDLRDRGKELYAGEIGEMNTKVVDINYLGWNDMLQKYALTGHALPDCVKAFELQPEASVIVRGKEDLL